MKIAIASGKGGTGKTTVSLNLFYFLSEMLENKVQLIDCDVEEPNDLLFLPHTILKHSIQEYSIIPAINIKECNFCQRCAEWCEFNAITMVKNIRFANVNDELCHSCGACFEACKHQVIAEKRKLLGLISEYQTPFGNGVIEGRLEIGSAMQTALIKRLKTYVNPHNKITILDAPPGTSCPVVETVSDADYIVLVTEPTPFGLNDLIITVDLLKILNKPFGVIVNKAGLGNNSIYRFLEQNNILLLGKIPFSKDYSVSYSKGQLLARINDETKETYGRIINELFKQLNV